MLSLLLKTSTIKVSITENTGINFKQTQQYLKTKQNKTKTPKQNKSKKSLQVLFCTIPPTSIVSFLIPTFVLIVCANVSISFFDLCFSIKNVHCSSGVMIIYVVTKLYTLRDQ